MNNRGFTLIELLMVVVIMAAISGIVVVSYQNIYNKTGDKYYDVLEKNTVFWLILKFFSY